MHTVLAFMTLLKLYDASHNDGREYILLKYADLVSRISYLVSRHNDGREYILLKYADITVYISYLVSRRDSLLTAGTL